MRVRLQSTDTRAKAEEILIKGYRRMSPAAKLACIGEMNQAVQQMALARIRSRYPDETDREHQLRLASLWLSQEVMVQVFDWDPSIKGY